MEQALVYAVIFFAGLIAIAILQKLLKFTMFIAKICWVILFIILLSMFLTGNVPF